MHDYLIREELTLLLGILVVITILLVCSVVMCFLDWLAYRAIRRAMKPCGEEDDNR